jgi:hypothetical protein
VAYRMSDFDESCLEVGVALAAAPVALTARTSVAARGAYARPRSRVASRWKDAHVHAQLGDDDCGQIPLDTWDLDPS